MACPKANGYFVLAIDLPYQRFGRHLHTYGIHFALQLQQAVLLIHFLHQHDLVKTDIHVRFTELAINVQEFHGLKLQHFHILFCPFYTWKAYFVFLH